METKLDSMGLKELTQQEKEKTNGGGRLARIIGWIWGFEARVIAEDMKHNPYWQK